MIPETPAQLATSKLDVDPVLLNATIDGTVAGLQMCGVSPRAIGASGLYSPRNAFAVIVGLVGRSSGSITMNLSETGILKLVGSLVGEELESVSEDTLDGIMEIGNMVAGSVKETLRGSCFEIDHISMPSVIWGEGYHVRYSRGLTTCGVEFELSEIPFSLDEERIFSTTISLLEVGA